MAPDIKEVIKDNENYGYDDLGLLSLPQFFIIDLFLPFNKGYLFVISESAKTHRPTQNKNKFQEYSLTGNSIKENGGQLTVSESLAQFLITI